MTNGRRRERRVFTAEFKLEAIRHLRERKAVGVPVTQLARAITDFQTMPLRYACAARRAHAALRAHAARASRLSQARELQADSCHIRDRTRYHCTGP